MASPDINLADRSGSLLESHKGYDPRIIFFYFVLALILLTLAIGLGYQQLSKTGDYSKAERQQNQRRIIVPGPRGTIKDRNGNLLVGNRPRFSVRLLLDTLRGEMRDEQLRIGRNFTRSGAEKSELPTTSQLREIARVSVVQRYLDQVNRILGRDEKVDPVDLKTHFQRELLLPYTLIDDLDPGEYARLLERLPVNSPAQVYTFSTRYYPYGSAAAHTLGYVGADDNPEVEDLPGEDLKTFKMKGTMGRDGIEKKFDDLLQGEAGGAIFRVDPAGNRVHPALKTVPPKIGKDLALSLDVDLQLAAEAKLAETEMAGAAVAIDVNTGEVLVLASKPDYDLREFTPRLTQKTYGEIQAKGGWLNRATQGLYMPGSTFKIPVAIAGLRSGVITPSGTNNCPGFFRVGNRDFDCHDRHAHGNIDLTVAIEKSCNVFFYRYGLEMGGEIMANEARRFHLDRPTGIELPNEQRGMLIPDPAWKRKTSDQPWLGGDSANTAIGQGAVTVTPLQMACLAASVARDEVWTQPTILHQPGRPRQQHEKTGLTPDQRAELIRGMELVTGPGGTAKIFANRALLDPLSFKFAAKTGTAQKRTEKGTINFAWIIGFAPVDNPQIAFAVAIEGDTPGEEQGGGRYAGPVAHAMLKMWNDKRLRPSSQPVRFKSE
jgi:penicillin-binding protein 2